MSSISQTTLNVMTAIYGKVESKGAFTASMNNFCISGEPEQFKTLTSGSGLLADAQSGAVHTSGYLTTTGNPIQAPVVTGVVTVTNGQQSSWVYPDGTTVVPSGGINIPSNTPYIGDIPFGNPNTVPTPGLISPNYLPNPYSPNSWPIYPPPVPVAPKLEDLEEGTHDIPGGKIIIKKILVDDATLDAALAEELKHEPSEQEKEDLRKELIAISENEDREI